jgi:hypothetical protein
MKKTLLLLLCLFFVVIPVLGLQQTAGELISNISVGNSSILRYGLKNDENHSIIVTFNVTGTISDFIDYQREIILEPDQFIYVQLNASIPSNYSGDVIKLTGIISVLKTGDKTKQIQINTQLSKKITININNSNSYNLGAYLAGSIFILIICFVGIVCMRLMRE